MTAREQLFAYVATLVALVVVVMGAMITAAIDPDILGKVEAFGIGTVTGGLIGVLRIPSLRNPVASTESGDVNLQEKEPDP